MQDEEKRERLHAGPDVAALEAKAWTLDGQHGVSGSCTE